MNCAVLKLRWLSNAISDLGAFDFFGFRISDFRISKPLTEGEREVSNDPPVRPEFPPRAAAILRQGLADGIHIGAQVYVAKDGQTVADFAIGESRPASP